MSRILVTKQPLALLVSLHHLLLGLLQGLTKVEIMSILERKAGARAWCHVLLTQQPLALMVSLDHQSLTPCTRRQHRLGPIHCSASGSERMSSEDFLWAPFGVHLLCRCRHMLCTTEQPQVASWWPSCKMSGAELMAVQVVSGRIHQQKLC